MSVYRHLTPTQIASLAEMVLRSRFKCKFRVQFYQDPIKFGFTMKLFFDTEDGRPVQLEADYEEDINEADFLNQELYAKISLMR